MNGGKVRVYYIDADAKAEVEDEVEATEMDIRNVLMVHSFDC